MVLNKPWTDISPAALEDLPGALGVFELRDPGGDISYIGFAGGRTRYGLRSAITDSIDQLSASGARPDGFRYEVNQMYLTRYIEVLEKYIQAAGNIPPGNRAPGAYIPNVIHHKLERIRHSQKDAL
ncbi:MAG: hypothetical protein AMXMBFR80_08270 [Dehalococcoidia bacterium]|jgi:hypothetical protein|nr:hypothetical protein [Tepidiformaceae bacterium]